MSTATSHPFLDFFGQIRIINLPARADRRQETESEFSTHGFPGPAENGLFFPAIAPEEAAGFPNRGVRGCYLSHLSILRQARDAGVDCLLILEDDIAFSRDIARLGPQAVQALARQDWDIAYFGHALPGTPGEARWLAVTQPMLLAHCYAVNGRILAKLVAFLEAILARPPGHPEGGPMHYDGALNTFLQQHPETRALYFSRNLGYQRPSRTDLHRMSVLDRNPVLRQFAGLIRAIKRLYLRLRS
jgi:glycosyl transferase, family 25